MHVFTNNLLVFGSGALVGGTVVNNWVENLIVLVSDTLWVLVVRAEQSGSIQHSSPGGFFNTQPGRSG